MKSALTGEQIFTTFLICKMLCEQFLNNFFFQDEWKSKLEGWKTGKEPKHFGMWGSGKEPQLLQANRTEV